MNELRRPTTWILMFAFALAMWAIADPTSLLRALVRIGVLS